MPKRDGQVEDLQTPQPKMFGGDRAEALSALPRAHGVLVSLAVRPASAAIGTVGDDQRPRTWSLLRLPPMRHPLSASARPSGVDRVRKACFEGSASMGGADYASHDA